MQDPTIKPKRMIDIKADCVKAVDMYMHVKAESNNFIKLVYIKTIIICLSSIGYINLFTYVFKKKVRGQLLLGLSWRKLQWFREISKIKSSLKNLI